MSAAKDREEQPVDRALERLVDVTLEEQFGAGSLGLDDLAERVAAEVADGAADSHGAVQGDGSPSPFRRVWTGLLVAAGLAVVSVVGWQASQARQNPESRGPGEQEAGEQEAGEQEAGEQGSGEQGRQQPERDLKMELTSIGQLRELLPDVVRVECVAQHFGPYLDGGPGRDRSRTPKVVADPWVLREVKRTFGQLKPSDSAKLASWQHELRLVLGDGRYVPFTYSASRMLKHMSFAGLGDVEYQPALQKVFSGLLKKADWAAQRHHGLVLAPKDLERSGNDGFPADLKRLIFAGVQGLDLTLVARFQNLRELRFASGASDQVKDLDFGSIAQMPQLESVSLRGCQVWMSQLEDLVQLPALRRLDMEAAFVMTDRLALPDGDRQASVWEALLRSHTLEVLRVSKTGIDGADLDSLSRIPNLTSFTLTDSKLDGVTPEDLAMLARLTKLQELDLSNVPVEMAPMLRAIADAGIPLRRLDLSNTKLSEVEAKQIGRLTTLRDLRLAWCRFPSGEALKEIAKLPLQRLDLEGAKGLGEGYLRWFQSAQVSTTLEELLLRQTPLSDSGCRVFSDGGMPRLRALDLSFTRVGDGGLNALRSASALETLRFVNCDRITDAGLRSIVSAATPFPSSNEGGQPVLRTLKSLRAIDLSLCDDLTESAVRAFAEARPDCSVRATQFGLDPVR